MESDVAALQELKRWGRLLVRLRETPSGKLRRAAVEGLMLRGLPEMVVLEAVSTVVDSVSSPQDGRLTASVERLDFGLLTPGQFGSLEFEVQGGQGRVLVEGEQIRVTPQQFGPKPTRIRVEVRSRAGDLLWDNLRLVTTEETVTVEVLAQWKSQSRVPEPSFSASPVIEPEVKKPPRRQTKRAKRKVATPTPVSAAPRMSLGDTWMRPVDGMVMVCVPAGEFQMGNNDGDTDEKPAHATALDGFWLDRTPVTNSQYARFLNERGNRRQDGVTWINLGSDRCRIRRGGTGHKVRPAYADHPVVEVSWHGAEAYAEWAGVRLPAEAEWEYAARGSGGVTYPWGNRFDGRRANCLGTGTEDTMPVGSFPGGASWCGALDLAGNVWEWVADWYGSYSSRRQVNPKGPRSGKSRVLRGGSWSGNAKSLRSTFRLQRAPDFTNLNVGFRCARRL